MAPGAIEKYERGAAEPDAAGGLRPYKKKLCTGPDQSLTVTVFTSV